MSNPDQILAEIEALIDRAAPTAPSPRRNVFTARRQTGVTTAARHVQTERRPPEIGPSWVYLD